jgi:hypothetical protein
LIFRARGGVLGLTCFDLGHMANPLNDLSAMLRANSKSAEAMSNRRRPPDAAARDEGAIASDHEAPLIAPDHPKIRNDLDSIFPKLADFRWFPTVAAVYWLLERCIENDCFDEDYSTTERGF